jgi:integrase/recombinase XerD
MTGTAPNQITEREFERARTALVDAYVARGLRASGRNITSVFHRLRLTLFHAGRLDTYCHPSRRAPVSITGWAAVTPAFAETARRYVAQVTLSLRPSTVKPSVYTFG